MPVGRQPRDINGLTLPLTKELSQIDLPTFHHLE